MCRSISWSRGAQDGIAGGSWPWGSLAQVLPGDSWWSWPRHHPLGAPQVRRLDTDPRRAPRLGPCLLDRAQREGSRALPALGSRAQRTPPFFHSPSEGELYSSLKAMGCVGPRPEQQTPAQSPRVTLALGLPFLVPHPSQAPRPPPIPQHRPVPRQPRFLREVLLVSPPQTPAFAA